MHSEGLGSFLAAERPCPCFRCGGWSVHPSPCQQGSCSPYALVSRPWGAASGGLMGTRGETPPDLSLLHVWVQMHPMATQLGPCFTQRGAQLTQGLLKHLPVSTVVFYLQQGLFSKSSLKWLCLSSLLLYELKKKPTQHQQNKK